MFEHGITAVRVDFHLHTNRDKEFKYNGEPNEYIGSYIAALKEKQIQVGVITNHNKFDLEEYKNLRKKARKENILLLPGVELSVNQGYNGVHTLIVFEPEGWIGGGSDRINSFLNAAFLNIDNRENENTRCRYSLEDTISTLNSFEKDYFIIFAHVDQRSGLLEECGGGMLESLSRIPGFHERVLALQKIRDYERAGNLRQWIGRIPPNVEGSDPKSIGEIGKGRESWLRLGALNFEAVKYALQDHENRILSKTPEIAHGNILSAEFIGGKLGGVRLDFSDRLNTMIGIRGSGKSTILEVIRYALTLDAKEDKPYKENLIKEAIGSGGKVVLTVRDQHGKVYTISRIFDQIPQVFDSAGVLVDLRAISVLRNPLYFGQKDLSGSSNYEFELLKRLVGNRIENIDDQLKEANDAVQSAVEEHLAAIEALEQSRETEGLLHEAEHKMKIFQESGIESKLSQQTGCDNDKTALEDIRKQTASALKSIKNAVAKFDAGKLHLNDHISEFNPDIIEQANEVLRQMHTSADLMRGNIGGMEALLKRFDQVAHSLSERIQSHQEEFAEVRRSLQAESLDPDAYLNLSSQIAELEKKLSGQREMAAGLEASRQKLRRALDQRTGILMKVNGAYSEETDKINSRQKELQISITFQGNREGFKEHMKKNLRGSTVSDIQYGQISEKLADYAAMLEDIFLNNGELLRSVLNASAYHNLCMFLTRRYEALLDYYTEDRVQIEYHGKALSRHSIGQRASALILFLLSQTDSDLLIIDQPEDDLDNKVIYEELIRTLNGRKSDLQFIFATHNANIPVLGDSEKVIVAEYTQEAICVSQGNIDDPDTRLQIINIMEGGKKAFNRRKSIYANWHSC